MKILSVIGARPQFIKAAPLSKELRKKFKEVLVHTGQHYDYGMSPIFFQELSIPQPDYNLGVGSGSHAQQTGQMIASLEKVLEKEKPNMVLVYGDTNSTIAAALVAAKLPIPIAHVESGLRSFNRDMPEEINRVVTDHLSQLLFCPTETAAENLRQEGITRGIHNVGDVMYDALIFYKKLAEQKSEILKNLILKPKSYLFATIHRAENTDKEAKVENIFQAFGESAEVIILPIHPRTKKMLKQFKIKTPRNVRIIEPLGYLDSLQLQSNAKKVLTDSGGIQKEAYLLKVPCITLRNETEWVETVKDGWNVLVGSDKSKIIKAINDSRPRKNQSKHYGYGSSSKKITNIIEEYLRNNA